jgi:hypothetical protein
LRDSVTRKVDDRPVARAFSGNDSGTSGDPMREAVDSSVGLALVDGVSVQNRAANDALLAEAEAGQWWDSSPLPIG